MEKIPNLPLEGRKALILGIANEHSIAYGCARAFRELGAELAITYANDKARPYVEPLARELGAALVMPLDVSKQGEMDALFDAIRRTWGRLDTAVHSIAFAPKADLQGGLINSSAEGFATAMDVSCHSFIRMARLATVDGSGRNAVRDELSGCLQGRAELRSDGTGQGGARGDVPISRARAWSARHSRSSDFAGAAQDACRVGAQGFRFAAQ